MSTAPYEEHYVLDIPPELQQLPQWVVWRFEPNPDPTKKPKKVPYNARTRRKADNTAPADWSTFAQTVDASQRYGFDGAGFVLSPNDPFTGIDLDSCRDPETSAIEPWAMEIVAALNSYTELSPSQTGVHIIVKGALPPEGRKKGKIEMYDAGRYFTVTGLHLGGTPTTIEVRQVELEHVHASVFGAKQGKAEANGHANGHTLLNDEKVIALAQRAKNSALFSRLWKGDLADYTSPSEADLSLCNLLAFYGGPHGATQIDRLFRQSGLFRPKWDEQHFSDGLTYGQATIAKALSGTKEFYCGRSPTEDKQAFPPILSWTDTGNAERIVRRSGDSLRYCWPWQKWLLWNEKSWTVDTKGKIFLLAKETVKAIATEEAKGATEDVQFKALLSWAKQSLNSSRIHAMVDLARSEAGIPVDVGDLDRSPWLLNVANGTLNLKTGKLQPHCRNDLLTKISPIAYDPEASCHRWEQFLSEIMGGNEEVIEFLWKAIGYSLTGDIREDCLFLLHGTGANGKSTFLGILRALLGDYGKQAAFSTFLHQEREAIRNDVADLRGARLVVAGETDEGRRLSESLIKSMTGRDPVKARFLFQENFEFIPEMKIWLAANHKPVIRGTDYAMWRRMRLVPFDEKFEGEQQDKTLPEKLHAELPGILAWAVRGCLAWRQDGLPLPETVKAATDGYKAEMDTAGNFITSCCEIGPYYQVRTSDLYNAYVVWSGDKRITQNAFGRLLTERGYLIHNKRWRTGLRLMSESEA